MSERRYYGRLAAAALAAALSACHQPPSLTQNLPSDLAVAAKDFDQRVKSRFPVGSPSVALVRELSNEGFRPADMLGSPPVIHWYRFDRDGFPCAYIWNVGWSADSAGRITKSTGVYAASCL